VTETELLLVILTISGFISTSVVVVLWAVRNFIRTKSGKAIDSARGRHRQLVLSATPDHHARFVEVSQFMPGVSETAKFKQRTRKSRLVFSSPKNTDVALQLSEIDEAKTEEDRKKSLELTQECLTHMLKANTEKVFIENSVPVTLAVEDKVVTTGVKGIGAMAYYEKLTRIDRIKDKIEALKNNDVFREVGDYLGSLAAQVSLIDINVLRSYFDSDYDQIDEESKNEWYYLQGSRDMQKKEKQIEKWAIIGGCAIGAIGLVGGLVFAYLSKGG
jgi:hypothetical protein